jgi:hypothetical protein
MKPMTKMLNPLIKKAAGKKHFGMAAQIHHRGRRSGKQFVTPASARPAGDHIIAPLTFGTQSDWCRNVLAAGGCQIRYRGVDYIATDPEIVDRMSLPPWARSSFSRLERFLFPVIGIKYFLLLRNAAMSDSTNAPAGR